jgi:hypothetical protein
MKVSVFQGAISDDAYQRAVGFFLADEGRHADLFCAFLIGGFIVQSQDDDRTVRLGFDQFFRHAQSIDAGELNPHEDNVRLKFLRELQCLRTVTHFAHNQQVWFQGKVHTKSETDARLFVNK